MFAIIIPNYNNGKWLDRLFESIYNQTYDGDYDIIFVDDMSTDNSVEIARKWSAKFDHKAVNIWITKNKIKRWNGGSRNAAISSGWCFHDYTLFIDSDDCFADEHCLEEIAKTIEENDHPDCVRLSYIMCKDGNETLVDLSSQDTVEKIVHDVNVACWTKCIKTKLLVPFPENTLMEDVVQHIRQMDVIDSVATCSKGIVKWNRNNSNSCSNNVELQDGKWRSSLYRYYADLLDLRVEKPECQAELEKRKAIASTNIRCNRFEQ